MTTDTLIRRVARRDRVLLNRSWQLVASDLLTRCASVPSRERMQRPQLKADLAENVSRTYNAIWRMAHARQNAIVGFSWAKLAVACGYPDDEKAYWIGDTVIRRYLALMAEAGLLRYGGVTDETGRWSHVEIELLEPPILEPARGCSSVGWSVTLDLSCEARRRRENKRQRDDRRDAPYRRRGGRGRTVARHDLFWGSNVSGRGLLPSSKVEDLQGRACARGPAAALDVGSDAQQPWRELSRSAALAKLRRSVITEGSGSLRAAAERGADAVAVALVGWELHTDGRHPKLSARRRGQLERSAAQMDRVALFGAGQVGAGAVRILDMLEAAAADGALATIGSLGLFVTELRAEAREWRRQARGQDKVRDTGQRDRMRSARRGEVWSWR